MPRLKVKVLGKTFESRCGQQSTRIGCTRRPSAISCSRDLSFLGFSLTRRKHNAFYQYVAIGINRINCKVNQIFCVFKFLKNKF